MTYFIYPNYALDAVLNKMNELFSIEFELIPEEKQIINEVAIEYILNSKIPTYNMVRNSMGRYYPDLESKTSDYKGKELSLYTLFTLLISYVPDERIQSLETFSNDIYRQLFDGVEKEYLINYFYYLQQGLRIIEPKRNKLLLVNIASKLEGSANIYRTGSGATEETKIRFELFTRLTNRKPHKRTNKKGLLKNGKDEDKDEDKDDDEANDEDPDIQDRNDKSHNINHHHDETNQPIKRQKTN